MTHRTDITELTVDHIGQTVCVAGHVKSSRGNEDKIYFVHLVDSGHGHDKSLQLVFDATARGKSAPNMTVGATLQVIGTIVAGKAKEPFEMMVDIIMFYSPVLDPGTYPFAAKAVIDLEGHRRQPHLESKTAIKGGIYTIRSHMFHLWSLYFMAKSWTLCHPPILTSSECESGCQPFGVTLLTTQGTPILPQKKDKDGNQTGQIDWKQDFFKGPRFMTVSYQLELEEQLAALTGKAPREVPNLASLLQRSLSAIYPLDSTLPHGVYSTGFTGRGEPSDSTDHLAIFQMGEIEIPFIESSKPIIDISEEVIKFICFGILKEYRHVLELLAKHDHLGFDKERPQKLEQWVSKPFIRITHAQAITLMLESKDAFLIKPAYTADLTREHERWLTTYFDAFVVVMRFPKEIKAFYMPVVQETPEESYGVEHVDSFDILAPELGEIVGGSRRIHDPIELRQRIQERGMDSQPLSRYIALRETGSFKSGGMGIGMERLLKYIVGAKSVRDVIPHPCYYQSGDI